MVRCGEWTSKTQLCPRRRQEETLNYVFELRESVQLRRLHYNKCSFLAQMVKWVEQLEKQEAVGNEFGLTFSQHKNNLLKSTLAEGTTWS